MLHKLFSVSCLFAVSLCFVFAVRSDTATLKLVQNNPQYIGKMHPALAATAEAEGVLKGNDDEGNPVIAVPAGNEKKLEDSKAVKKVEPAPDKWSPVKKLMLKYDGTPPSKKELEDMGLELVEDYKPGSFLIVRVAKGKQIDAAMIKSLEKCPSIIRVEPDMKVRAF
jgi:hypothetical protein